MGWDGAGAYNRVHNFSADASAGIKILASRMDAEINDIASAIPIAWARNGQNVPTVDMPMGGKKFVNVGAPTSVGNFMRVREFIENVPVFMQDVESSADRISVSSQYFTSVSANQAPVDGTKIMVRVNSNKSSAVLYVDGHSANITYQDGNRIGPALVSGGIYEFTYSSVDTAWVVPTPSDGRTAAEIAAGVTPTNLKYPEGYVKRYGAIGNGIADDSAAFIAAQTVAANSSRSVSGYSDPRGYIEIVLSPGTYLITSAKAMMDGAILASKQFGLSFRGTYGLTDVLYQPTVSGALCENKKWLGVRFYGIGFSCDDAASDFLASAEQGGITNIQDFGFTDCSWAGTWRYINILTGDNNNSEWSWTKCWVSGTLTTFLYTAAAGTSDNFLNFWFKDFKFWPASGSWIDMSLGGHIKITDCDSSGWEPTVDTYLFNLRGNNHARGVCSFKASGLRVEQKTDNALVMFAEWEQCNISFRDCDFGSQSSLVVGATSMVSALFSPGNTAGSLVTWDGCTIMGKHRYLRDQSAQGMNRIRYETCEFANFDHIDEAIVFDSAGTQIGNIAPIRIRNCRGQLAKSYADADFPVLGRFGNAQRKILMIVDAVGSLPDFAGYGTLTGYVPLGCFITRVTIFVPNGTNGSASATAGFTVQDANATVLATLALNPYSAGGQVDTAMYVLCNTRNKATISLVPNAGNDQVADNALCLIEYI